MELIVESAARLADRMPDGVWLVELAPLRDPWDVPQAVLAALDVREAALLERAKTVQDAMGRLVGVLAGKRLLLVLDNCEHLVEAAARLADRLLAACPGVHVLATSREPLGITGETLCQVPPLALPPAHAAAEEAVAYPAVQLFADRAAAVRPGFTVDARNAAAVVEICRRLDGMPLAIELAAARLRALSAEQVAARLGDRFRLLTGGSRTALPRHQTLRAVVAWSWDLLTEPERILARRLSVFAGGVTLESAERVCAGDGLAGEDVLDLLLALVDKSLLEAAGDGEVRYRMLETIRAFGAERLAEAGEADRVRAAHARYFLELAETAEPRLRTADQVAWLARLGAEHDNLLAALRWAVGSGNAEVAVRLGAALGWFWSLRGNHAEAVEWLREALSVPGDAPPEARALALAFSAMNTVARDTRQARDALAVAREAWAAVGQAQAHPVFLMTDAVVAAMADDQPRLRTAIDRGLAHPDPWMRAATSLVRAVLGINEGDAAGAERDFEAALAGFRAVGDRWGQAMALSGLAEIRAVHGDHTGALAGCQEALGLVTELGARGDVPSLLARLGVERARAGDPARGRADLEEALELGRRFGSPEVGALAHCGLGEAARRSGDLAQARRHYEAALATLGRSEPDQLRAMALTGFGYVAVAAGDAEQARALHTEAVEIGIATRDMPVLAAAVEGLAGLAMFQGDPERAAALLGVAAALRGMPDAGNPDVTRLGTAAREALGWAAYAEAYERGAALSREEALAFVRAAR